MYVNAWCGQKHNQIHWSHFLVTVRSDKSLPHRSLNADIPSYLLFLYLAVKGVRAILPCICGRCGLCCFPSERWSGCTGDRVLCSSPADLAAKSSGTLPPLPCSSGKLLIPPPGCRYTPWLDSWWQHCPPSPEINKLTIKKLSCKFQWEATSLFFSAASAVLQCMSVRVWPLWGCLTRKLLHAEWIHKT